jgi:LmbE family N-acetylglucosaminyl deacetylase
MRELEGMVDQQKHIMFIGAHAADMEFTAGALAAKYTREGHKATFLSLTLGEKGHRSLSPKEYAEQKKHEATECARLLGAQALWLDIPDGELVVDEATKIKVAEVIRQVRPTTVITHWKGSFHKDHANTHFIVQDARFYATLKTYEVPSGLPAAPGFRFFFAENWEDPYDYDPQVYVDTTDVHDQWVEACNQFEIFRPGGSSFRYQDYYRALSVARGAIGSYQHAITLMRDKWIFQDRVGGLV